MKTAPSLRPSAKQKGDQLEDAVRAIEHSILSVAPGLAEGTFRMQQKRIVNAAGVRHEIDLFVTASLAAGYEATFIFECKNWKLKVGKNEIIVFTEKVAAASAQSGFFVARAFTKDARAQAAKDSRVRLLVASHVQPLVNMQFPQLVHTAIGKTEVHIKFGVASGTVTESPPGPDEQLHVVEGVWPARDLNDWIDRVRHKQVCASSVADMPDGEHMVQLAAVQHFAEGQARLGGAPLRCIELTGVAKVTVVRASVLSIFEVASRGRLLKVGIDHGDISVRADIVELEQ